MSIKRLAKNIADKLQCTYETKLEIKDAIITKGVEVSDTDNFEDYPERILEISGGNNTIEALDKSIKSYNVGDKVGLLKHLQTTISNRVAGPIYRYAVTNNGKFIVDGQGLNNFDDSSRFQEFGNEELKYIIYNNNGFSIQNSSNNQYLINEYGYVDLQNETSGNPFFIAPNYIYSNGVIKKIDTFSGSVLSSDTGPTLFDGYGLACGFMLNNKLYFLANKTDTLSLTLYEITFNNGSYSVSELNTFERLVPLKDNYVVVSYLTGNKIITTISSDVDYLVIFNVDRNYVITRDTTQNNTIVPLGYAGFYNFNPANNILTCASRDSLQYSVFKYSNNHWTPLNIDLTGVFEAGNNFVSFNDRIYFDENLTRGIIIGKDLGYVDYAYKSFYILKSIPDYCVVNEAVQNKNTITGFVKEKLEGKYIVYVPSLGEVTVTAESDLDDFNLEFS